MPADAVDNVRKAQEATLGLPRSESAKTIVERDRPTNDAAVTLPSNAVRLNVGIPCIVSLQLPAASPSPPRKPSTASPAQLRSRVSSKPAAAPRPATSAKAAAGGAKKVRAQVRYLGPVAGLAGVWVGVQLHLPPSLLSGLTTTDALPRLQDGAFKGTQYFAPSRKTQEAAETDARRQRRTELWRALSPTSPFPESGSRADGGESGGNGDAGYVELFVRPHDVVWVVQ